MVEVIVFLEHEEALVTLELLLDMLDVRGHLGLDIALLRLELVCSLIEGENQEVDCKA